MKRLGILLLCLSIGGSSVLTAAKEKYTPDEMVVLLGFTEQTKSLTMKNLHELEEKAKEGEESDINKWNLHCELSYKGLKLAIDNCHKETSSDEAVASQLKEKASYLYNYSIRTRNGGQPKTVFPFRSAIARLFWTVTNTNGKGFRAAKQTWREVEESCGESAKKIFLSLISGCSRIAEKGGFSGSHKQVSLAGMGSSLLVGDTSKGSKYEAEEQKISKLEKILKGIVSLGTIPIGLLFGKKVYKSYKDMKERHDSGEKVCDYDGEVLHKNHQFLAKALRDAGKDAWKKGIRWVVKGWMFVKKLFCRSKGYGEIDIDLDDIKLLVKVREDDLKKVISDEKVSTKKKVEKKDDVVVKEEETVVVSAKKEADGPKDENVNPIEQFDFGLLQKNFDDLKRREKEEKKSEDNPSGEVNKGYVEEVTQVEISRRNEADEEAAKIIKQIKEKFAAKKKKNTEPSERNQTDDEAVLQKTIQETQNIMDQMDDTFVNFDDDDFESFVSEGEKTKIVRNDEETGLFKDEETKMENDGESFQKKLKARTKNIKRPFYLEGKEGGDDEDEQMVKDQPENQPTSEGWFSWGLNLVKKGYNVVIKKVVRRFY